MKIYIAVLSSLLLLPIAVMGKGLNQHDAIKALVYPPELVMKNQAAIQLSKDQRRDIAGELSSAQGDFVSLQFELAGFSEELAALLSTARVDEGAALEVAGVIMDIESQIKHRHLTLAIRIKNMLSAVRK